MDSSRTARPAGPRRLAELAERLRSLAPSCGSSRLVGVDGFAGSGKTTFAARLAEALSGAPVVHLDDFATHRDLFGWTDRLTERVLRPLAAGRPARFPVYDWESRRFSGAVEVPPAPVVLIEGVGAGRARLRPYLAELVWMEIGTDPASPDAAHARGEARDGPELAEFWRCWIAAEAAHFAADPSLGYAGVRVDGTTGGIHTRSPRHTGAPAGPLTPPPDDRTLRHGV
jgi:hypothetical protein